MASRMNFVIDHSISNHGKFSFVSFSSSFSTAHFNSLCILLVLWWVRSPRFSRLLIEHCLHQKRPVCTSSDAQKFFLSFSFRTMETLTNLSSYLVFSPSMKGWNCYFIVQFPNVLSSGMNKGANTTFITQKHLDGCFRFSNKLLPKPTTFLTLWFVLADSFKSFTNRGFPITGGSEYMNYRVQNRGRLLRNRELVVSDLRDKGHPRETRLCSTTPLVLLECASLCPSRASREKLARACIIRV